MFKEKNTYNPLKEYLDKKMETTMGLMYSFTWNNDPKHVGFTISRYKFVSKMLEGKKNVLEVGCCDGWPSRVVKSSVKKLTAVDFDPKFIEIAKSNMSKKYKTNFLVHDMTKSPLLKKKFDSIYSVDVLEHIPKKKEKKFIKNILSNLDKKGSLIIGTPSKESQGSPKFRKAKGHINCKTGYELKKMLSKYFSNVFLFLMNDELIHTGMPKLSNYLFCICTNKK